MKITELNDESYSVAQVAQLCRVRPGAVWRWVLRGCRGVKLASFLVGARRRVSRSALEEFLAACNRSLEPDGQGPAPRPSVSQERLAAIEAAEREFNEN